MSTYRLPKAAARAVVVVVVVVVAVALTLTAIASTVAPRADADADWGLNGTYTATSNGEWAKTNDVFHALPSIRSIWTVTTTCSFSTECTGTVDSDWGWRGPIYQTGGVWYVKLVVDDWQPCPDGSAGPGFKVFRFAPTNPDGTAVDPESTTLTGADETTGLSGSCGSSKTLFFTMPFKLVKTG